MCKKQEFIENLSLCKKDFLCELGIYCLAIRDWRVTFPKQIAICLLCLFQDDQEGPVTKSVRLTTSLILRNIAKYSSIGRTKMQSFESFLRFLIVCTLEQEQFSLRKDLVPLHFLGWSLVSCSRNAFVNLPSTPGTKLTQSLIKTYHSGPIPLFPILHDHCVNSILLPLSVLF